MALQARHTTAVTHTQSRHHSTTWLQVGPKGTHQTIQPRLSLFFAASSACPMDTGTPCERSQSHGRPKVVHHCCPLASDAILIRYKTPHDWDAPSQRRFSRIQIDGIGRRDEIQRGRPARGMQRRPLSEPGRLPSARFLTSDDDTAVQPRPTCNWFSFTLSSICSPKVLSKSSGILDVYGTRHYWKYLEYSSSTLEAA